jgi:hypothetical protein
MVGMRILGGASGSRSQSSEKASRSSVLEIHFWTPSRIQAISPLVDRLMLLIEGSQCIRGEEPDVELALREALANAVAHGNEKGQIKVHIRAVAEPATKLRSWSPIKVRDLTSEILLTARWGLLANISTEFS